MSVSVGKRIFLYRVSDGELIRQMKGHKSQVYSLSYSCDGEIMASGGSDKCTILWTKEGKGFLKFSHDTSVQVVAFNPVRISLVSCACNDFGFWSPDNQSVKKYRVDSKILSAAWRSDGEVLAIGHLSGEIRLACESGVIRRTIAGSAPAWALTWGWRSYDGMADETLVAGTWDAKISFYDRAGLLLREQDTNGFSAALSMYSRDLFLISTTGDGLSIMNGKGKILSKVAIECDWAWCARGFKSENSSTIAYVGNNGNLVLTKLSHEYFVCERNGLIAYTESGTTIIVHDQNSGTSTVVECETCVLGLAITRNILAISLKGKITVLSLRPCDETKDVTFNRIYDIEVHSSPVIHLVGDQVVVAYANHLCLYCRSGDKFREWSLLSNISCLSVASTKSEDSKFLIGCVDGQIMKMGIHDISPTETVKLEIGIKSIVASTLGNLIGIVDWANNLQVYNQAETSFNLQQKGLISSVLFHNKVEDLFCYCNNRKLIVHDGNVESTVPDADECRVITFHGSQIAILSQGAISILNVDFDSIVKQKILSSEFESALSISQLGVSDPVWKELATCSLIGLNLNVALSAYSHLGDTTNINMVNRLQMDSKVSNEMMTQEEMVQVVTAEMDILEGNYEKAGETFVSIGRSNRAIELFVEKKMFRDANKLSSQQGTTQIKYVLLKEAEWEEERGNFSQASDLYMRSEAFAKSVDAATRIGGDKGLSKVYHIASALSSSEQEALNQCCDYLALESQAENQLREILIKMQDYSRLMAFYIKTKSWLDVSKLREEQSCDFDKELLLPYAQWLAANGNIVKALEVNREAGYSERNTSLLNFLIKNAIAQECFLEVSKLYWVAAKENVSIGLAKVSSLFFCHSCASMPKLDLLTTLQTGKASEVMQTKTSEETKRLAIMYRIYSSIIDFSLGIFSTLSPKTALLSCAYLLNALSCGHANHGIDMPRLLFIFAELGRSHECFQSTRAAYDLIACDFHEDLCEELKEKLSDEMMMIEVSKLLFQKINSKSYSNRHKISLVVKTLPMEDCEDLLTVCFRCGASQSLLRPDGDYCSCCNAVIIRCMITFHGLPLIEFVPHASLSAKKALDTITRFSTAYPEKLFHDTINLALITEMNVYHPVEVGSEILESFDRSDVYIVKDSKGDTKYYKNMIENVGIAKCPSCFCFFHEQEFEFHCLKEGGCPICDTPVTENVSSDFLYFVHCQMIMHISFVLISS